MFSRFKKPDTPGQVGSGHATVGVALPGQRANPMGQTQAPANPAPKAPAEAIAADKEKKRKERLQELKVELHKRLLESLKSGRT